MSNNRRETRHKTFLKGCIVFNGGASSMDCLVRDMSDNGARVLLTQTAALPEVFDLVIPQKDRTYKAFLRWRRTDGLGVTFAPERPVPAAAAEPEDNPAAAMALLLKRIADLEAENAALRRLLSQPAAAQAKLVV